MLQTSLRCAGCQLPGSARSRIWRRSFIDRRAYLIASYALAAIDAGNYRRQRVQPRNYERSRIRKTEAAIGRWKRTHLFYGGGLAGRWKPLRSWSRRSDGLKGPIRCGGDGASSNDPMVRTGLLFLLRAKDRYGVWFQRRRRSTCWDTLITLLGTPASDLQTVGNRVEVIINGQPATSLELTGNQPTSVISADISRFLKSENEQSSLRRAAGAPLFRSQLVANYYVPGSRLSRRIAAPVTAESGSLRLETTFDKSSAGITRRFPVALKPSGWAFAVME